MSRLLGLPPELRLTIFELVVASPEPVIIPLSGKKARPALLHVSRQICFEAIRAYYKLNSFRFLCDGENEDLPAFSKAAGAENHSLIRSFMLDIGFSQQTLASNETAYRQSRLLGGDQDVGYCECFYYTCMPCSGALILVGELLMHGLRAEAIGMSSLPNGQTSTKRSIEQVMFERVHKRSAGSVQIEDRHADLFHRKRQLQMVQRIREQLLDGTLSPAEISKRVEDARKAK